MTTSLTATDRLKAALQKITEANLPDHVYQGQYECRVLTVAPGPPVSISAVPTSVKYATLLGAIFANIVLWPGPSGAYAVPVVGSLCRVAFVASQNTWLPAVVGLDPSVPPTLVTIGTPAAAPLTPAPWSTALLLALEAFAAGLTTSNLNAKAATLAGALPLLGPIATIQTRAS